MDIYTKTILIRFLFLGMWGSIAFFAGILIAYRLTCQDIKQLQHQKQNVDISMNPAVLNQNQYQLRMAEKNRSRFRKWLPVSGAVTLIITILFFVIRITA